jgi:hypothetical protein
LDEIEAESITFALRSVEVVEKAVLLILLGIFLEDSLLVIPCHSSSFLAPLRLEVWGYTN